MNKSAVVACQQNLFEVKPVNRQPKVKDKSEFAFVLDIVDALQGPILTFSPAWADTIPQRMLRLVPFARMKALMLKENLATYLEVAIYIYTRSLDAPMDSDWVDIYTHVCCTVTQEYFNEDHWDTVRATKILSDWLKSKLNDLRRHIYEKRRQILTQRLKAEEGDMPKATITKSKSEPIAQQQTLFGDQ